MQGRYVRVPRRRRRRRCCHVLRSPGCPFCLLWGVHACPHDVSLLRRSVGRSVSRAVVEVVVLVLLLLLLFAAACDVCKKRTPANQSINNQSTVPYPPPTDAPTHPIGDELDRMSLSSSSSSKGVRSSWRPRRGKRNPRRRRKRLRSWRRRSDSSWSTRSRCECGGSAPRRPSARARSTATRTSTGSAGRTRRRWRSRCSVVVREV